MHLSMSSRRGGRRGIGRDFDRSLWPGGRAFELSCCPGARDFWIFVRACDHKSFPGQGISVIFDHTFLPIFKHNKQHSKWFEPRSISRSYCVIVRVRVVLKRTVVGDWRFYNLSGSHLQSQVKNLTRAFQPIPSWLNWPITFNGPTL